jgi:hypothetical protein
MISATVDELTHLNRVTPPARAVASAEAMDWPGITKGLNEYGNAVLSGALTVQECNGLAGLYANEEGFRSRVVMASHGFGRGEYKYFSYPLPDLIGGLRASLYRKLVPVANAWNESMKVDVRYPSEHAEFIERCHAAGQTRPTPLLLQYETGDFNCLHQDLYGEHAFPIQVAFLLSQPGRDFTGGEFVLTEQRPRMQSRPEVVRLFQGDAAASAVHHRPGQGTRGVYRVNMRHGVSRLFSATVTQWGSFFTTPVRPRAFRQKARSSRFRTERHGPKRGWIDRIHLAEGS